MRAALLVTIALVGCNGGGDSTTDSGTSAITAPVVTTVPAENAPSSRDVDVVITTDSEGPGEITYEYRWLSDNGLTWTTPTLPSTATSRGETWTVSVTPYSGTVSGPPGEATVSIVNGAPTLEAASFSPSTPTIGQDLTCVPVNGEDPDGDALTYVFAWTRDGSPLAESTDTLASSEVQVGATIECSVYATDGTDDSPTRTVSGAATNSPPTSTGSTITPSNPASTDDVTCAGEGGVDPDGDAVAWTYEWYVNGSRVPNESGETLSESYYVVGDVLNCSAIPNDGSAAGSGVVSGNVTVGNGLPVIASVSLTPTTPYNGDTLVCDVVGSDPDGTTLNWSYEWTLDGTVQSETSNLYLGTIVYGNEFTCTATATDGTDSVSQTSNTVTVANTLPVATTPSITPNSPIASNALTCASTGSDADGQSVGLSYQWTVGTNTYTGAGLPANTASKGDTVTCTVTPNDGVADGAAVSASVVIQNTAPPTPTVSINPTSPGTANDLTCSASPTTDSDGDTINYTYTWTIAGSTVGTGPTLASSATSGGDTVTCSATGSDGTDTSPAGTASVRITNSLPVVSASITPTVAQAQADDLICAVSASDPDGGTPSVTVTWEFLNYSNTWVAWTTGLETTTYTNDTINAADTVAGRQYRCTATATDTAGGSANGVSSARSVGAPPGCTGGIATGGALAGPYSAYGECFYTSTWGQTCDQACASQGQENVSHFGKDLWPDACSGGPTTADPVRWFYEHGNPANTTGTQHSFSGAGLGYTRNNQVHTGKCTTGNSIYGTYAGSTNQDSSVSSICVCGDEQVMTNTSPTTSFTGTNYYRGNTYQVTTDTALNAFSQYMNPGVSCSVDYFVFETASVSGPWTLLFTRRETEAAGAGYKLVDNVNLKLKAGKMYNIGAAWNCSSAQYYEVAPGGSSIGTFLTSAYSNAYDGTTPSAFTPAEGGGAHYSQQHYIYQ
ncbi:MAG: hypothetical protein EP330_16590 [Deltaproteobacteria bacterium]|nr:MAG: hypothetical protein EP330_16590 [Deltaproteobacteria bacterium]